ncbi:MAG: sugar-transfer associated ATP-grasp domain-containing protein [Paracoccaceae bacterium]
MMQFVAQKHGVSVSRQLREIFSLRYGRGKLMPHEYYRLHVYRPDLSRSQKSEFLGDRAAQALNYGLTAPELAGARYLVDQKPVFLALCAASNIACTQTQAMYSPRQTVGPWEQLRSAADMVAFLEHSARYPIFGKPTDGKQSIGGVQIERLDSDGHLRYGEDIQGPHVKAFVAEVLAKFPNGYLFQTCENLAKDLRGLAPKGLGPMRLNSILTEHGEPHVFFGSFRMPIEGTESGPTKSKRRYFAHLDLQNSTIISARERTDGINTLLEHQPVTGTKLPGFKVEQLPDAIALVKAAHMLTPEIGIIGWDVALTDKGPLIIEGNGNPACNHFQLVTGRGILTAEHKALFTAAKARADAISAEIKAGKVEWQLGVIRDVVALERGRFNS